MIAGFNALPISMSFIVSLAHPFTLVSVTFNDTKPTPLKFNNASLLFSDIMIAFPLITFHEYVDPLANVVEYTTDF